MKALQYRKSIPRYALMMLAGRRFRRLYTAGISPFSLRDVPEPVLPAPKWVRIKPRMAGICGSDLATICATGSPYLAPVTSMPFVMGHELVGHVTEVGADVTEFHEGDRVVLHPALGCRARGIDPMCDSCANSRDALCRNVTRGCVSSGIQTGFCRDTGGGFGEGLVAHESQLYRVPDGMDDRVAVLIEPFGCALHGVLQVSPRPDDTVLVIGCGSIGLLTILALRAAGCRSRIVAVARHDHQRAIATAFGADDFLDSSGAIMSRYKTWAETLDAEVLKPELGKPMVIGGAAVTFDCVASSATIDDGIRFTKSAGIYVLVGMPGIPRGVDWTPLWYKELTIRAAYAYGPERFADGTHETFDLAIDMCGKLADKLPLLTGAPFALADYRAAFASAVDTRASGVAKTLFDLG